MNLMKAVLESMTGDKLATPASLAMQLNVSPELVDLILVDLERTGYIRSIVDDGTHCAGCRLHSHCNAPAPRLWMRTEK
jgi:hypothetical protein